MSYIVIGARRHPIDVGESTIGGASATHPLPGATEDAACASIDRSPDDVVSIRPLRGDVAVVVDGRRVPAEGCALVHGAKIEILGRTVFYGDARRSAGTERVAGVGDEVASPLDGSLPVAAADTGGRLVALADGREWLVPDDGLDIGRDPACDVVVASLDASRWHATIERTLLGYAVRDSSSNGVRVNGARIDETRLLAPGDVLHIGGETFRFDADPAPSEPAAAPPDEASRPRLAASPSPVRAAAPPPLLATLEVLNEGPHKGDRIRIERSSVRIGRSARGDVVFRDDSVSGTHATLERRDGAWMLVDHDATNGTYVDGDRLRGRTRLAGPAELRFGNVKVLFRPIAAGSVETPDAERDVLPPPGGDTSGTRGIIGV